MTIQDVLIKYQKKITYLDLELLIASSLGKTREFVLTYPEYKISSPKIKSLKLKISRRMRGEPIAYILGHKEFYGLDFIVNKDTLIPRPETEMMVDEVLSLLRNMLRSKITVIDIGTGSGCIIISIAKAIDNFKFQISNFKFHGTDISKEALKIAKKNAKVNGVNKKIKFLHGNLLEPFFSETKKLSKLKPNKLFITANLPYLSKEIYNSAPIDVKKFEPKSALYSPENGLAHYHKLLLQIKELSILSSQLSVVCYLEISPEQKSSAAKLVKKIFPKASTEFKKDLANKWRTCKIDIAMSS